MFIKDLNIKLNGASNITISFSKISSTEMARNVFRALSVNEYREPWNVIYGLHYIESIGLNEFIGTNTC